MNSKTKLLIGAVALSVAGTANAAIKPMTNGSDMFISMFRDTAAPATVVLDTGIRFVDLVANPLAFDGYTLGNGSGNVNVGSAISDFLATGTTGEFVFNAAAGNLATLGIAVTASTLDSYAQGSPGLNTAIQTVGAHINTLNSTYGVGTTNNDSNVYNDADDGLGIEGGDPGEHNASQWGDQVGSTFTGSTNTEGTINNALNTYYFHLDQVGNTVYELLGTWTIFSNNGSAVFNAASQPPAVPVPAAVWLLGSALVGMVGVARRRVGA